MADITYKGLTGLLGTVTVDLATDTFDTLIAAIASDEGLPTDYYHVALERDPSKNDRDFADSSTPLTLDDVDIAMVDGDTVICTPNQNSLTKQERQVMKLEIAQLKRQGGSAGDTSARYYRTNNEYAISALPNPYEGNVNLVDENPNTGGLLPSRPWNTAVGVAGVDVSALTLSSGLVERTYESDYFGDKTSPYDDQTAYDAFFGGSPTVNYIAGVTELSRNGTVATTTTYTLLGYFKPDVTGTWNFRIRSDDGSYLFLGDTAEVNDQDAPTNITLSDAVVNNGGKHAAANADGDFYLVADTYYYMYAIFGNDTGPGTALFYYTKPGESENTDGTGGVSDFTGLVFYNTATSGQ